MACLLHDLISHPDVEIPDALETFIEDYLHSRANTLDPDWTRLEALFIRSCQEHSSTIYVVLGNLENVPERDRQKIFEIVCKLWDTKRCKLLVSMDSTFLKTFKQMFGELLSESGTQFFEIIPNAGDIQKYISSRLVAGPHFMQTDDIFARIVKKLLEK